MNIAKEATFLPGLRGSAGVPSLLRTPLSGILVRVKPSAASHFQSGLRSGVNMVNHDIMMVIAVMMARMKLV